MNNSEDLTLVYVQPPATSFLLRPPPLRDLQAAMPHSTFHNLFVSSSPAAPRSLSCPLTDRSLFDLRLTSLRTISRPLRGSSAYLNARAKRCLSSDLSLPRVSDARTPRESLCRIGVWSSSASPDSWGPDVERNRYGTQNL